VTPPRQTFAHAPHCYYELKKIQKNADYVEFKGTMSIQFLACNWKWFNSRNTKKTMAFLKITFLPEK